jgi:hypothetical protein
VLYFVADPYPPVNRFVERLCSGSYLAVSHLSHIEAGRDWLHKTGAFFGTVSWCERIALYCCGVPSSGSDRG